MPFTSLLRCTLAASVSLVFLAGCPAPGMQPVARPGAQQPGAVAPAGGTPAGNTASGASSTASASFGAQAKDPVAQDGANFALLADSDMDVYDLMVEDTAPAKYLLAAATPTPTPRPSASAAPTPKPAASGPAAPKPGAKPYAGPRARSAFKGHFRPGDRAKILATRAALRNAKKADLDARKDERAAIAAAMAAAKPVDKADGTSTHSFSFQATRTIDGKTVNRQVTMERTYTNATKILVGLKTTFTESLSDGTSHMAQRELTLQQDGGYHAVLHSEFTNKDGTKRIADLDKSIAIDGKVTGSAKIGNADAKGQVPRYVVLVLAGTQDAPKAQSAAATKPAGSAKPAAKPAAQQKAAAAMQVAAKLGNAGLKVANAAKGKKPIAAPPPAKKYGLFQVDDATVPPSSDDAPTDDAALGVEVTEGAATTAPANDGNPGDQVVSNSLTVADDGGSHESGQEQVNQTVGADGEAKGGEIAYTPDADAQADGAVTEDIKYDVAGGDQCNMQVALDDPNGDGKDNASLTEKTDTEGNVATEGDITLADGGRIHMHAVVHDDGSRDLTCIGDGFAIRIENIQPDGTGEGTVYDGDPNGDATEIGVVTLRGDGNNTIAFYEDDGEHLGEEQPFALAL